MVAAMRRDLHLTDAQIAKRVRTEAAAPTVESGLRERLGSSFAGAWIPDGGDRLTVAVTDPRPSPRYAPRAPMPRWSLTASGSSTSR
ncbi:hypothetical protein NKG94_50730 [Micromonospora sp. M12]